MEGQVVGAHEQVPSVAPHPVQRTIRKPEDLNACEFCGLRICTGKGLRIHRRMHVESPPRREYKRTTRGDPFIGDAWAMVRKYMAQVPRTSRATNWALQERQLREQESDKE